MIEQTSWWRRLALIASLVERAPGQVLGRTAIIKLAYLLQTLRGVPIGYDFRLYTYGPFDSDVLYDLDSACSLQAITVKTVEYPAGYGYEVRPGPEGEKVKTRAADWLRHYEDDINWVVDAFSGRTASDLELLATSVYVDRELAARGQRKVAIEELVRRVREVKPHFSEAAVTQLVRTGQAEGWLSAVVAPPQANSRSIE
jgi:hypothetical protein